MGYIAIGTVYIDALDLPEITQKCREMMQHCQALEFMQIYNGEEQIGKMKRDIVFESKNPPPDMEGDLF